VFGKETLSKYSNYNLYKLFEESGERAPGNDKCLKVR
jgi:hypothetical protein